MASLELRAVQKSDQYQDKSVWLKINFLISQPKHMLWVLKVTVSVRQLNQAAKTYVKTDRYEDIHTCSLNLLCGPIYKLSEKCEYYYV